MVFKQFQFFFFSFFLMSSPESPYVEHEIKEEDGRGCVDDKGNLTHVGQLCWLFNSR